MAYLEGRELSEIKHGAETARIRLNENEIRVKNLTEKVRDNKQKSRENIVKLFTELKDLLNKKRTELLVNEYDTYQPVDTVLSTCTHSIYMGLHAVTELLEDAEVDAGRRVPIERLRLMTAVIDNEITKCEQLVGNVQIPEVFVANSNAKNVIGDLQYGDAESAGIDNLVDSSDRDGNANMSENEPASIATDIFAADSTSERDTAIASGNGSDRNNADNVPQNVASIMGEDRNSHEAQSSDIPANTTINRPETANNNSVVPSAPSYDAVEDTEPAPLYVALDDDEEEPPPPYWQAVGLSPPGDSRAGMGEEYRGVPSTSIAEESNNRSRDVAEEEIGGYNREMSFHREVSDSAYSNYDPEDWERGVASAYMAEETSDRDRDITEEDFSADYGRDEDEVWVSADKVGKLCEVKSFPAWKANEKDPMLISLSWKQNRLCFADKNNQSLKFYEATGEQIVKMSFSSEIGDTAFLDDDRDVAKYIVTFPKDYIIMIVSIDSYGIPNVVRRIRVKEKYTAICKGPRDYTFIVAVTEPRAGSPRVDVCNFSGNVTLSLAYTREGTCFAHPTSVAVFKHFAVIADSKLNLVCVYNVLKGGSLRSQYNGVFENKLVHPCDLAVDTHGTILILEFESRKIHVINLSCQLLKVVEIPAFGSVTSVPRSMALEAIPVLRGYEDLSPRLAVISLDGYVCVFDFKGGYKRLREIGRRRWAVRSDSSISDMGSEGQVVRSGMEGMLPSTVSGLGSPNSGHGLEGVLPITAFGLPNQRRSPRQGYGNFMEDTDLIESTL